MTNEEKPNLERSGADAGEAASEPDGDERTLAARVRSWRAERREASSGAQEEGADAAGDADVASEIAAGESSGADDPADLKLADPSSEPDEADVEGADETVPEDDREGAERWLPRGATPRPPRQARMTPPSTAATAPGLAIEPEPLAATAPAQPAESPAQAIDPQDPLRPSEPANAGLPGALDELHRRVNAVERRAMESLEVEIRTQQEALGALAEQRTGLESEVHADRKRIVATAAKAGELEAEVNAQRESIAATLTAQRRLERELAKHRDSMEVTVRELREQLELAREALAERAGGEDPDTATKVELERARAETAEASREAADELGRLRAETAKARRETAGELEHLRIETAEARREAAGELERERELRAGELDRLRATLEQARERSAELAQAEILKIHESYSREQAAVLEATRSMLTRIEALDAKVAEVDSRARMGDELAKALNRYQDQHRSEPETDEEGRIDINAASFEDLRSLGLSVTQAARLVALRDARGGFTSKDEIGELPGLPSELMTELLTRVHL